MDQPPTPPAGGQGPGAPDWGEMKSKVISAAGPDRLLMILGVLFFVDSFLPWYGVKGFLGSIARAQGVNPNVKGWSAGGLAVLSILCALGVLVVALLGALGNMSGSSTATLTLALSLGALVFAALRLLTETNFTRYGLYVAIVLGAIMAYTSYQKYRAVST